MTPENSSALPDSVVERLKSQKARQDQGAFTSSFGVGEFLLAKQSGYEALGQVMGATVFQIGIQWSNPNWSDSARRKAATEGYSMELTTMTAAYANARDKALSRLEAEAAALGAEGVVGVTLRIKTSHDENAQRVIEFVAIGTAVKTPLGRKGAPFLSNLSGAELWQLNNAGYEPCGLVFGNCSYQQSLSRNTQQALAIVIGKAMRNFEVEEYTRGFYTARELATERLYEQARTLGAHGIVGVSLKLEEAHTLPQGSASAGTMLSLITFSFQAIGTAIRTASHRSTTASKFDSLPFTVISLQE